MANLKIVKGDKGKAAPAAKPAKAAKAKAEKTVHPRKFAGVTSGLGVREFQNGVLSKQAKTKLTDEQIASLFRKEFPMAVAYTVEHVRGIRSAYNKGKHGNVKPDQPVPEYGADGKALPLWGSKTAAKKAAAAESAAPAPKVKKAAKK